MLAGFPPLFFAAKISGLELLQILKHAGEYTPPPAP